jgi:heat shock protein HtpX
MANLYTQVSNNVAKTWMLMSVFFVFLMGFGWILGRASNNPGIFYIFVVISVVMNIASYWFSDKIVMSISHARLIEKKDSPELYRIVENLAITGGLPTPKVYIIDTPAMNAFATGRDPAHGAVAVTTGLLRALEKTELEGVVAHEMSHIGNRDTLIATVVVILAGLIAMLSDFFLRMTFWGGGRRRDSQDSGGSGIFLIIGLVAAIIAPIAATILRLAISRKREFLADASGALLTRYPEGLARALEKLERDHTPMPFARSATSHLYIDYPLGKEERSASWFTRLFLTHPPIAERIAALRMMKAE